MNNEVTKTMLSKAQEIYAEQSRSLREFLKATTKQVQLVIDEAELVTLKENGYSLCFAKKVGNFNYNVIWKSMNNYLVNNIFSWTPVYQIFGTNTFEDNIKVIAFTNVKDIGLGETTILDLYGNLSNPVTGGDSTAINADNKYGKIHFGISQVSVNQDGHMESTPIYVSENVSISGTAKFQPVEKVQIWFQANAETGTMFAELRSNAIELDLTNRNSVSVEYKDGKWAII